MATVTSVLAATIGFLSAYAFTRFHFRGGTFLPLFYLVVRMVPRITLVLPLYVIFTQLHLLNTRAALIVSYTTFALPFGIWMMIGFLKELPIDLEEAAAVDGCNRWQILQKVVVPLAAPGIATTAIFAFLLGWNEFLFSLILAGPDSRTLPVLIASFDSDRGMLVGSVQRRCRGDHAAGRHICPDSAAAHRERPDDGRRQGLGHLHACVILSRLARKDQHDRYS